MLQAMLNGKLTRDEVGMEDLLTSNVFGLLKYAPPGVGLFPWLSLAHYPLTGQRLATWLGPGTQVEAMEFWPQMAEPDCTPCEPDVSIILHHADGSRTWLLVEAKFRSGKSSFASDGETPPNDQLAREYDNLVKAAARRGVQRCAVLFVTVDITCPVEELQASAAEFQAKRQGQAQLFWLSWRALPDILSTATPCSVMLQDLRDLLLQLDLTMYRRLRLPMPLVTAWRFQRKQRGWRWAAKVAAWGFTASSTTKARTAPVCDRGATTFSFSRRVDPQQYFRWRRP